MIQPPAKVITDTAGLKILATMNKEDQSKLRKGQWASLETVMENIRRSGMDEKTVLEIASERVKWRISRMIAQLPDEDLIRLFTELKTTNP